MNSIVTEKPLCTFNPCERPQSAKRLCKNHYEQQRRGKPLTATSRRYPTPQHGSHTMYNLHKCRCEMCVEFKREVYRKSREARLTQDIPEHREHGHVRTYQWGCRCEACTIANSDYAVQIRYGFTEEEYASVKARRNGDCECCGRKEPSGLVIDHDHVTGLVRGLICNVCNTGIGKLGDNREGLLRAIAYLDRHLSAA